MREATIEELAQQLPALVDASQHERIVVTRNGQPVAVLLGIENKDAEDLRLEAAPEFWRLIEERRRHPTARLEDVEADLFHEDR
jgi:prevent-host-death family protein